MNTEAGVCVVGEGEGGRSWELIEGKGESRNCSKVNVNFNVRPWLLEATIKCLSSIRTTHDDAQSNMMTITMMMMTMTMTMMIMMMNQLNGKLQQQLLLEILQWEHHNFGAWTEKPLTELWAFYAFKIYVFKFIVVIVICRCCSCCSCCYWCCCCCCRINSRDSRRWRCRLSWFQSRMQMNMG